MEENSTYAPLDLDAIEARANAATSGPLTVGPDPGCSGTCDECETGCDNTEHALIKAPSGAGIFIVLVGDRVDADVAFALSARADVLRVVAHVRWLENMLWQSRCAPLGCLFTAVSHVANTVPERFIPILNGGQSPLSKRARAWAMRVARRWVAAGGFRPTSLATQSPR